MKTLLFAMPLKPGKFGEYKKFVAEATGPRKKEYAEMLKRYGLKNVKVWHCKFESKEYMMVMHDSEEEAQKHLKEWSSSSHPFDRWFNEQILKCYDIQSIETVQDQPQLVFEFNG